MRTSEKYAPDAQATDRVNATLLALVRNSEVNEMVASMEDLERTWNSKFNYPWTFFNDEPFSEEFMAKTKAATKAKCNYGMYALTLFALRWLVGICHLTVPKKSFPRSIGRYHLGSINSYTTNPPLFLKKPASSMPS